MIANGEDAFAARWVDVELKNLQDAKAEVLDPFTLAILGATLIGCILAARVSKIGSVEFYQGVPKELADVLKAAAPAINVKVDT